MYTICVLCVSVCICMLVYQCMYVNMFIYIVANPNGSHGYMEPLSDGVHRFSTVNLFSYYFGFRLSFFALI